MYGSLRGLKLLKPQKVGQKKKGHFWAVFWWKPPFSGPKKCVSEIQLVSLVGVGTQNKVLRYYPNPISYDQSP